MPKQEAFVIKHEGQYWCMGKKWSDNIDEALCYFKAENAERKGPGKGKVIRVVQTMTIKEVK